VSGKNATRFESADMKAVIKNCTIELCQGDIAAQEVDAIVNAANRHLAGGGGVDGAIHRAGGPAIMLDTRQRYPDGCPTGSAVIGAAGELSARYVIHAVGPVWNGGGDGEGELLAGAFRRSLQLAGEHACRSVALPALSTGAYGYPLEEASRVAISATVEHLRKSGTPSLVRFVLRGDAAFDAFVTALRKATSATKNSEW
jgi:O-acetyl-ADP-ribose deacetylase (regulator of RNase III)